MTLPIAPFIALASITGQPVKYKWSGPDAMVAVGSGNRAMEKRLVSLSARALLGLSAMSGEWLSQRFVHLSADPELDRLIEAVWAASIDFRYLRSDALKFPRDDKNSVRGPPQEAKRILQRQCSSFESVDGGMVRYVGNLANLVHYTLHDDKAFQAWLKAALAKLPATSAPPLTYSSNLPIESIEVEPVGCVDAIWGDPLPREAFDPSFDLMRADRAALIDAMLVAIAAKPNPFLRGPAELATDGFTGKPYRYPAS